MIEGLGLQAVILVSAPLGTLIYVQNDGYGFDTAFISVVVAISIVVLLYVIFVKKTAYQITVSILFASVVFSVFMLLFSHLEVSYILGLACRALLALALASLFIGLLIKTIWKKFREV